MSKDEKCTCKACKNTVFHCQICKFVGFLLPLSSWLLKLPVVVSPRTARNYPKERATRAARLFFIIQPMKVLNCYVIVAVPVVNAKTL